MALPKTLRRAGLMATAETWVEWMPCPMYDQCSPPSVVSHAPRSKVPATMRFGLRGIDRHAGAGWLGQRAGDPLGAVGADIDDADVVLTGGDEPEWGMRGHGERLSRLITRLLLSQCSSGLSRNGVRLSLIHISEP